MSEDGLFPIIVFKKGKETFECDISQDEEGNGPGFLFGLPFPPV
jgi:hypothetical protein